MAKKHIDYLTQFKSFGYKFQMNDMDDSVELNGKRLNDGMVAEIETKMDDAGFSVGACRRHWTYEAHKNRYHPLKDFFNGLQWDGDDYFGLVCSAFSFEDVEYAKIGLWRFMLGVVGKVMNKEQNFMLVLDGKQGIGKSYFSSWLCPLEQYFVEGTLNPDSNDTKLRIIANLIWEVGELQYTTRKSDVEAVKNIITQKTITTRPPYARQDIIKPVTCSFIGTINENGAGFLNDPTGSRRFYVVKINDIDWQAYTKIDKVKLWSQVVQAYKAGERGMLTDKEKQAQHERNSEYTLISSTHELLHKFYDIDPIAHPLVWTPAGDILLELFANGMTGSQRSAQMEISSIMEQLGVEKSNSNAVTGHGRVICYKGVVKR